MPGGVHLHGGGASHGIDELVGGVDVQGARQPLPAGQSRRKQGGRILGNGEPRGDVLTEATRNHAVSFAAFPVRDEIHPALVPEEISLLLVLEVASLPHPSRTGVSHPDGIELGCQKSLIRRENAQVPCPRVSPPRGGLHVGKAPIEEGDLGCGLGADHKAQSVTGGGHRQIQGCFPVSDGPAHRARAVFHPHVVELVQRSSAKEHAQGSAHATVAAEPQVGAVSRHDVGAGIALVEVAVGIVFLLQALPHDVVVDGLISCHVRHSFQFKFHVASMVCPLNRRR